MSTVELCGSLPCQDTPRTLDKALIKRESNKRKKKKKQVLKRSMQNVKNLFFSSLPKFTFSTSVRILCKKKKKGANK